MSGITGWIGFRELTPLLIRLEHLAHRGPDDQGEARYVSASGRVGAVLGSSRLALQDLSATGHLPLEHPEEPLALAHHGEIYNFPELRRELELAGERCRTRTNSEVILRGYQVWGGGVVERLRGRFALALWDGRENGRLVLARDPLGQKPLYYRFDERQGLSFSSELKTLVAHDRPREIDPSGLEYYLDRGFPPPDRCLIQGYRKVRPGCLLVWEEGRLTEKRYWNISEKIAGWTEMSPKEAAGILQERLIDGVPRQLPAGVPVGLLLSGGLNSGVLLSLMTRLLSEPVRTYAACFGNTNLTESELIRQSALSLGAPPHVILINSRCGRLLPLLASKMDEPTANPLALAMYLICRRAQEEVAVLFTGEGSNELLTEYVQDQVQSSSRALGRLLPSQVRQVLWRWLPPGLVNQDSPSAYLGSLPRDFSPWTEPLLLRLDQMSMAASVEVRAPFLDPDVTLLFLSWLLNGRFRFDGMMGFWDEAMQGLLPKGLSWPLKKPCSLPIDDWLQCDWRPLAQDVLLDPRTKERGWTKTQEVRRLLDEQLAGQARHGRRLYQLLILELWARALLDRGETESHPVSVADCFRELDPSRPLRHLAVIAPAGIGDTLRLTPGLKQLNQTDPNVSVTLYVARGREADQVMAGQAPVERQVPIDFNGRRVTRFLPLIRDLRRHPPDSLVSTLVSHCAGVVAALSGVTDRRGWVPQWSWAMRLNGLLWRQGEPYDPNQRDVGRQDALAFCQLLGLTGPESLLLFFAPPLWEERSLASARMRLEQLPRPILAVNAVAQPHIPQRQYPLLGLSQALAELLNQNVVNSAVLLGDSHSRACHGPLRAVLGPRGLDLSGELTLASSAAVLGDCNAVLTIDGGLLHVALSTPLPVVALYGPTEIFSTDPRGLSGRYTALSAFDRCRCECLNHRGIKERAECREEARCLASLSPGQIVAAVAALLGEAGTADAGAGKTP